jgi:hypothetical protein
MFKAKSPALSSRLTDSDAIAGVRDDFRHIVMSYEQAGTNIPLVILDTFSFSFLTAFLFGWNFVGILLDRDCVRHNVSKTEARLE